MFRCCAASTHAQHSRSSTVLCWNHFPPLIPSLSIDVLPPVTVQSTQKAKYHSENLLPGLSEEQHLCSAKCPAVPSRQRVLWGQTEPFPTTLQNGRVTKEFRTLEYSAMGYVGNSSNLHSASSLSSQTMQLGIWGISQASSTLWDVLIFPWGRNNNRVSYLWNNLLAPQFL